MAYLGRRRERGKAARALSRIARRNRGATQGTRDEFNGRIIERYVGDALAKLAISKKRVDTFSRARII